MKGRVGTMVAGVVDAGIKNGDWPYGAHEVDVQQRLVKWAERNTVRKATGMAPSNCLHWLEHGRCRDRYALGCVGRGNAPEDNWRDHMTTWVHAWTGRPALLLAQPYGICGEALQRLAAIDKLGPFKVSIGDGWYGHGSIPIQIWNREVYESIRALERRA